MNELPFDHAKQLAVLGHLLTDATFFLQGVNTIDPTWFLDSAVGKIWATKVAFYGRHNRIPSREELHQDFKLENSQTAQRMRILEVEALEMRERIGIDTFREELTNWLHARLYHSGVTKSEELFNRAQFKEAYAEIAEKVRKINETSFEQDVAVKFEDYSQFFEHQAASTKDALTTGLRVLDKIMLPQGEFTPLIREPSPFDAGNMDENGLLAMGTDPVTGKPTLAIDRSTGKFFYVDENTGGGYKRGEMTILVAPVNIGKTSMLITAAAANVKRGKRVLFLSHEGVEEDLIEKVWCCILGVDRSTLFEMQKTPVGRQMMDAALDRIRKYLTYIPMHRPGTTVEEVAAVIRKRQEALMVTCVDANGQRAGFDLVVDDYPAKLTAAHAGSGEFQKRNIDEYVYNYLGRLAEEYKFHLLCAIQTNRTGSKINKGHKGFEARLLDHEDVHESFGPIMTAANVLTLNRDPIAETGRYMTLYLSKTRSNSKGWAILCRTDFANCRAYSNDLGATFYRGTHVLGVTALKLIQQYQGIEIPESVLYSQPD